jgi:hypothetical protein
MKSTGPQEDPVNHLIVHEIIADRTTRRRRSVREVRRQAGARR